LGDRHKETHSASDNRQQVTRSTPPIITQASVLSLSTDFIVQRPLPLPCIKVPPSSPPSSQNSISPFPPPHSTTYPYIVSNSTLTPRSQTAIHALLRHRHSHVYHQNLKIQTNPPFPPTDWKLNSTAVARRDDPQKMTQRRSAPLDAGLGMCNSDGEGSSMQAMQ
jgi:hypothetical protein